jgi:hypothetical protein
MRSRSGAHGPRSISGDVEALSLAYSALGRALANHELLRKNFNTVYFGS